MDLEKDLQTVIDYVGDVNKLILFGNFTCKTTLVIPYNIPDESYYNLRNKTKTEGLIFTGTHWISRKDNRVFNSCNMNLQLKNSDNFCQSFAVLNYLTNGDIEKLGFIKNDYISNCQLCAQLWCNYLISIKKERLKVYKILKNISINHNNIAEIFTMSSSFE